jgi:hypothetical protein
LIGQIRPVVPFPRQDFSRVALTGNDAPTQPRLTAFFRAFVVTAPLGHDNVR